VIGEGTTTHTTLILAKDASAVLHTFDEEILHHHATHSTATAASKETAKTFVDIAISTPQKEYI
jgi:hypothetical protein